MQRSPGAGHPILTILHVCDEEGDRLLFAKATQELKLDLRLAAVPNAEQAVRYLLGQGEFADRSLHPLPDLVVAELRMRGPDGFFLLDWRNSTPAFSRLPVIALTDSLHPGDPERALQLGAAAVLTKPFAFDGWCQTAHDIYQRALKLFPQRRS